MTNTEKAPQCPQCRSKKTQSLGVLQGYRCEYCENEWTNISERDINEAVVEDDKIKLPDKLKNPVTVVSIEKRTLKLEGNSGGMYRLKIMEDGTGYLRRKKAPSERNQFGKKWTNSDETTFELLSNSDSDLQKED
jgi:uncharacterized Zn ribbon protein